MLRVDHDNLGRFSNVYVERLRVKIVNRPTGTAGTSISARTALRIEVHDRERVRTRLLPGPQRWRRSQPPRMIVGEAVGAGADRYL